MVPEPELIERLYRSLFRIRRVEEEVARIYPTDKIKSPVHLSIGQEAVAVGVCDPLRKDDILFGTYRDHATYLAKGGDLRRMMAELYGKATGCAKGKGGSMHLIDLDAGSMGASAIVGTTIPHAVGYAYALRLERSDRLVVSMFGDGAVDEGAFHESLNWAAVQKLPVLFVCENNHYAIHSHHLSRHASDNLCERARTYGMAAERIEENDALAVRTRIAAALDELRRSGAGPRFVECMTYRMKEHVGPNDDFDRGYRKPEEAEPWKKSDPVRAMGARLSPEARTRIERAVEGEIRDAFEFAEKSPFPDLKELHTDVYAE
ncbi:MAG: thiamine pyrophosphate-dependent dehydrogenase E1 component subunit alpha [Planctomycetes bacterium]|nr:thiamine pyrophosphate-dependent dehydrogenase E1 component subunit alpha [Planctomycetota bacterium]